jgi:predicted ATP-dependent protease
MLGQDRAMQAVRFGTGMRRDGYNLFALGPPGLGKHDVVRRYLEEKAAQEPAPEDWVYVNNFTQPHKPRALRLPAGQAVALRRDMETLVEELKAVLPATLESEEFRARRKIVEEQFKERPEKALAELEKQAKERQVALIRTPGGLALAPVRDGQVLEPEEFERLPAEAQARVKADLRELQDHLQTILGTLPRWEREQRDRIRELRNEATRSAVGHLIRDLRARWEATPAVVEHLDAVQQDVVENVEDFLGGSEGGSEATPNWRRLLSGPPSFQRYQVNVLVDHGATRGAPVVFEDHPTQANLLGSIEHLSQLGTLVTDFTLIKPGALHRANGGYLIVDARKVLQQPYAWESLKRALRSRQIRIESVAQALGLASTVSLEPQPVDLEVKTVLVGERLLYYLLAEYDPDFPDLFKVAADFEDHLERSPEGELLYARLLGAIARRENLLPLDRGAAARAIEHGARLAADAEKLSAHVENLADLLREADYWAKEAERAVMTAADVQRAVDERTRRADRVRERTLEEIRRGTVLIDTQGGAVGQVNGLSVLRLGDFSFGRPSRITARVRLGSGGVVDIEREVALGGPIHSKGVLILAGFLGARYSAERPLSLAATLVFEQSYGGVEGDSASAAELFALLSALAEAPIRQGFAVTGSVDQRGRIQAVGGVNEKIEGFFDVCRERGLTGDQGVLIPASNVKHLMLRGDVVDAVAAGRFRVFPIETVEQGIGVLTGLPAGERDAQGQFPPDSFNQRVEARLVTFAEKARAFARPEKPEAGP